MSQCPQIWWCSRISKTHGHLLMQSMKQVHEEKILSTLASSDLSLLREEKRRLNRKRINILSFIIRYLRCGPRRTAFTSIRCFFKSFKMTSVSRSRISRSWFRISEMKSKSFGDNQKSGRSESTFSYCMATETRLIF